MSRKPKSHRLYPGDYRFSDDRTNARLELFRALRRVAPHVIRCLKRIALPTLYRDKAASKAGKEEDDGLFFWQIWDWARGIGLIPSDCNAANWWSRYSWVPEITTRILDYWSTKPAAANKLEYPS